MAVRLKSNRAINKIVSHEVGVRDAVHQEAVSIAGRAERNLAPHHKTGRAHIEVGQGKVDSFVSLVDPAAISIEFGHFMDNGEIEAEITYVPGLYVLTRAAGLAD